MVDENEFNIMEADDYRNDRFECDECDGMSRIKWKEEIDDETLEELEADGWRYSEGVLFCKDCAATCKAL